MEKVMNKKYKNEEYIKTKTGTINYPKAINLMEKIWPNKKSFTGDDVNKVYGGLLEDVNVKQLKQTVVEQPIRSKIKTMDFEIESLIKAKKELYKDLGKEVK
jgi:hypothetical protein|tara:strand:- start:400 stop:705 length:306 start_codon:yes stop_codon:yes gene_type:complete